MKKYANQSFVSENASYKIVALLITLILWVIILGSKEATVVKMIPTDYLLPKEMAVVNSVPHEVAFRITGPRLTLKRFTETAEPLVLDLTSAMEGMTTIRIHPDSIDVPAGLRVSSVSPTTITPRLERILTVKVPVQVQLQGSLAPGRKIASLRIEPSTWELRGLRSLVEGVRAVKTEPVDISGLQTSLTKEVGLIIDEPNSAKKRDARVKVELVIK